MFTVKANPLGIYEKALPPNTTWAEKLAIAKEAGFDFVEMSIDETPGRLARLDWSQQERQDLVRAMETEGITIRSLCLSAHRSYPLGSSDPMLQTKGLEMMAKAIALAKDLGIRVIQLAGYDVFYERSTSETQQRFMDSLEVVKGMAAAGGVILGFENMDTPLMDSITKIMKTCNTLNSPWVQAYPDVGNLAANHYSLEEELRLGISRILSIHLKDTLPVTETSPGKFRDIPFGEGCVDFNQVFRTLNALHYQGAYVIEMWSEKLADPIGEIKKAREWILNQMKTAGDEFSQ